MAPNDAGGAHFAAHNSLRLPPNTRRQSLQKDSVPSLLSNDAIAAHITIPGLSFAAGHAQQQPQQLSSNDMLRNQFNLLPRPLELLQAPTLAVVAESRQSLKSSSASTESPITARAAKLFSSMAVSSPGNELRHGGAKTPPCVEYRALRRGPSCTFHIALFNMLEQAQKKGYQHIVSWQPHGRAFRIHNKKLFVKDVMPKYFKQTKFGSFQRQLCNYGLKRISTPTNPDHGSYYHESFLRGKPELCYTMDRVRTKPSDDASRGSDDMALPLKEPNFYRMPPVDEPPKSEAEGSISKSLAVTGGADTRRVDRTDSLADCDPEPLPLSYPSLMPKNDFASSPSSLPCANNHVQFQSDLSLVYGESLDGGIGVDHDRTNTNATRDANNKHVGFNIGHNECPDLAFDVSDMVFGELEDMACFLSQEEWSCSESEDEALLSAFPLPMLDSGWYGESNGASEYQDWRSGSSCN